MKSLFRELKKPFFFFFFSTFLFLIPLLAEDSFKMVQLVFLFCSSVSLLVRFIFFFLISLPPLFLCRSVHIALSIYYFFAIIFINFEFIFVNFLLFITLKFFIILEEFSTSVVF